MGFTACPTGRNLYAPKAFGVKGLFMTKHHASASYAHLHDGHGRGINYLRLSVTDRCNLRCLYCAPQVEGMEFIPHEEVLSYEEFLRLVRLAVGFGVKKVRLTGGEPFARAGFMDFFRALREEFPGLIIGITTNATMLGENMAELERLKLNSLNISLDTFRPEVFKQITGVDKFKSVLDGIMAGIDAGLTVKVNAVGLRGVNHDEIGDFIDFAAKHRVDFRIIEFMPLGGRGRWSDENFWAAEDILAEAQKHAVLVPSSRADKAAIPGELPSGQKPGLSGPAKLYDIKGGKGRFGIITPVSQHFCSTCNRLRITSEGKLRTCLFSDIEYDLRALLRDPNKTDADIYSLVHEANSVKPLGTELLQARKLREAVIQRSMSSIGG